MENTNNTGFYVEICILANNVISCMFLAQRHLKTTQPRGWLCKNIWDRLLRPFCFGSMFLVGVDNVYLHPLKCT